MDSTRTVYLFQRYFSHTATEAEKEELMTWISRDKNTEEIKALMDKAWEEFKEAGEVFTAGKSKKMLLHILQKELNLPGSQKQRPVKVSFGWFRAAAAATILALTAIGGFLWYVSTQPPTIASVNNSPKQISNDVAPGGKKAILTLANGKTIVLDSVQNGTLAQQGNTNVLKLNGGQLKYSKQLAARQSGSVVQFNTLSTPRSGQYQLVLPDGSKVWLNAASSIRFPTAFMGKERSVEITGEAYFEIAGNVTMPFKVRANDVTVVVLGTHFNLNAYKDEPSIKTTLLEGAVKIIKGTDSKLLKPGQQAAISKGNADIKVTKADINEAVAWKDGLFHFDGDDMGTIMRKIARWYDVTITYEGSIPTGHYTGIISRNTNLSQVLKMLELSGVHFKIKDGNILVM